jgi:hypothetical protein
MMEKKDVDNPVAVVSFYGEDEEIDKAEVSIIDDGENQSRTSLGLMMGGKALMKLRTR